MQYSAQIAKIDPKIAVKRVQCKLVYKEHPLTISKNQHFQIFNP